MPNFTDSELDAQIAHFDKDFNKEMIRFRRPGRMLDFAESELEPQIAYSDKDFNKEMIRFRRPDQLLDFADSELETPSAGFCHEDLF